ncbi:MAG: DNA-3-methyladenine glycosylase 2 family protein [Nitrospinota bacterium]|nr:DNA-3-methyladenine glycosylase 2 family protein [Nitrospinota bacterium]
MVDRRASTKDLPTRRRILNHFQERDPKIARVIQGIGPFRLKRNRNYFVVLCKSIVSQQISTAAADTIYTRFQNLFDGRVPTPERLAGLKDAPLRAAGLSRQKSAYLKDLSHRFLDGTVRPHQLNYLDNEEIVDRLTLVHGIGRWTAEMFMIFSLNRLNVLPVDDLGLRVAVQNIYGMKARPDAKRLLSLGKKWNPLETVATWYAWRSLNADIVNY